MTTRLLHVTTVPVTLRFLSGHVRHAERNGFEVHALSSPGRLTAGLKHKAAKGELRQGLPVGLDYDEDDRTMITPDEAVREAIVTVFRRFDELGSARQVLMRLREDGALLPRRANGSRRITWDTIVMREFGLGLGRRPHIKKFPHS